MALEIELMVCLGALSALFSVGAMAVSRTEEFIFLAGVGCVSTDAREVLGD